MRPLTILKPLLFAGLNVTLKCRLTACLSRRLTLRPDEDQGDVLHVAVLRHFGVVVIDGVEARLVLETEHEDHRVDPRGELKQNGREGL